MTETEFLNVCTEKLLEMFPDATPKQARLTAQDMLDNPEFYKMSLTTQKD